MRRQTFFLISFLLHLILLITFANLKFKQYSGMESLTSVEQPITIRLQSIPNKQVTRLISPDIPIIIKDFKMGSNIKGKDNKPLKPALKQKISRPLIPEKKPESSNQPEDKQKNIPEPKTKTVNKSKSLFNPYDYIGSNRTMSNNPGLSNPLANHNKKSTHIAKINFEDTDFSDFISEDKDYGQGDGKLAAGGNAVFNSHGYDITPWAKRVVYRIKKNWNIPASVNFGQNGIVNIYTVIQKQGNLAYLIVKKSSNVQSFDRAAFAAIKISAPFPQLPDDFPYNHIEGMIIFKYN